MTSNDQTVTIGDFIEVPAWNVSGMIVDTRPATFGSDDAIVVLLMHAPEEHCSKWRWYRLEPSEYVAL